jgi:acyl-CoA synthetase (AMP-forming)/AMP-acid ligase II
MTAVPSTDTVPGGGLGARIAAVLAIDPSAPAVESGGEWHSWGSLAAVAERVVDVVPGPGTEVGVVFRNRPSTVALLIGVLQAGGCIVAVNPTRGRDRTREDLAALDLPIVAGEAEDLTELLPDGSPATTVATTGLGEVQVTRGASEPGEGRVGVAVRMLTSGTTGPPKRIDLGYGTFVRVMAGAKHYEARRDAPLELRRGVAVVSAPLSHVGGLFRVLQCVLDGRSFALLDRFTVEGWVDAVRRHRPATASLVPAALRMVLDAGVDPEDLSSLRSIISGTAPLDPEDADAFFGRYGVPVLISYGATEFAGGVAGWNIRDHERWWATKRGSVGRAHGGCELRVVDPDSDPANGEALAPDTEGVLEVKAAQLPDAGWVRTTDLARIDGDGFLWICGRADEAIIRGGFKIAPDDVRVTLERHPAVRGAVVVGRADRRLGSVPVAVVELWPEAEPVDSAALTDFVAGCLAKYEVPAEIVVVDELVRTESGKADLSAARALVAGSPDE